jgi:hypothetical protein
MITATEPQNSANGLQRNASPISGLANSASSVAGDFVELAELQVHIVRSDLRAMLSRAAGPLTLLLIAPLIAMAGLPAVAIGIAHLIQSSSGMHLSSCYLIVGLSLSTMAVILLSVAIHFLRHSLTELNNSSRELANNIAWLKKVIRGAE